MPSVRVRENEPFEAALRRFKRTIEKTGLLTELRAREFYEKPTSERKRKKAAAIKRHYKRLRSQQLPPKLYGAARYRGRLTPAPQEGRSDSPLFAFGAPAPICIADPFPRGSPMPLKQTITDDMKDAMRARDAARLSTIRLLLAAIKQREVDERKDMTDADVLAIIDKMLKQRKDSIAQFEAGNRKDLADAERAEVTVLSAYQPAALSDAEVDAAIAAAIARTGASGPAGMGKVMAELKPQLAGRADMAAVSARTKAKLAG